VNFDYDDEQHALQEMARALFAKAYGDFEKRSLVTGSEPGYDPSLLRQMGDLGLLGLPFEVEVGGAAATLVHAGIVAREIGRVLAPEPFNANVTLPSWLIVSCATTEQQEDLLPSLLHGEAIGAVALHEMGSGWSTSAAAVTATLERDHWRLSGAKEPVLHGAEADVLLVSARLPDGGTGLFVVPADAVGLTRHGYVTTAHGRAARIHFARTRAVPLGSAVDVTEQIQTAWAIGQLMAAHEALGAMEVALQLTTKYLTQRTQFGKTLNKFQALTFRAADLYIELELADSMVQWATLVAVEGAPGALEASTRAAVQVSQAGRRMAQECIQLHGGIGMTAEHPIGAYSQRLTALTQLFGTPEHHLSQLAASVDDHDILEPLPSSAN